MKRVIPVGRAATAAAGVLAALAVAAAPATSQGDGRNAMTWRWDGQVSRGSWMRVYDVNGRIAVEPSPDGLVHVRAEKQVRSGGDPRSVRFAVARDGSNVSVCALWSDNATCDDEGAHNNRITSDNGDRRQNVGVVFTVQVPGAVRALASTVNGEVAVSRVSGEVSARTVNGAVEVRDTGGPVSARTVNGSVDVTTSGGPVSAETVNGTVDVTMGTQGSADMTFRSVNGSITIRTPSALDAAVDLRTVNGTVSSRYPLSYDRRRRSASGTVGRGGRELTARTVNGSVTLN